MAENNSNIEKLARFRAANEALKAKSVKDADEVFERIRVLEEENKALSVRLENASFSDKDLEKTYKKLVKDLEKANEKRENDLLKQKAIYEKKIENAILKEKEKAKVLLEKEKAKNQSLLTKEKQKTLKELNEKSITKTSDEKLEKIKEDLEKQKQLAITAVEKKYKEKLEKLNIEIINLKSQAKEAVPTDNKLLDTLKRYQSKIKTLEQKLIKHEEDEKEIKFLEDKVSGLEKRLLFTLSKEDASLIEEELNEIEKLLNLNKVEQTPKAEDEKVPLTSDEKLSDEELVIKYDQEFNRKNDLITKKLEETVLSYNKAKEELRLNLSENTLSQEKCYQRLEEIDEEIEKISSKLQATKDFLSEGRKALEKQRTRLNLEKDTRTQQLYLLQDEERPTIEARHMRKIKALEREIDAINNEKKELLAFHVKNFNNPFVKSRFKLTQNFSTDIVVNEEERSNAKEKRLITQEEKVKLLEQAQILEKELQKYLTDKKIIKYNELVKEKNKLLTKKLTTEAAISSLQEMNLTAKDLEKDLVLKNISEKEKELMLLNENLSVYEKQLQRLTSVRQVLEFVHKSSLYNEIKLELKKL